MKLKDLKQFLIFHSFREAIVISQNQSIPFEEHICLKNLIKSKYADHEITDIYVAVTEDLVVEIKE